MTAVRDSGYTEAMDDFPIAPPIIVRDEPKPRHLKTLKDARDYVEAAMRIGHPEPWREVWHRLKAVTDEEGAIEAIGDLRNCWPMKTCCCRLVMGRQAQP